MRPRTVYWHGVQPRSCRGRQRRGHPRERARKGFLVRVADGRSKALVSSDIPVGDNQARLTGRQLQGIDRPGYQGPPAQVDQPLVTATQPTRGTTGKYRRGDSCRFWNALRHYPMPQT